MPATPDRIAFVREQFRRAVAVTPAAATRHGNLARQSDDPIETYFDDIDDALTVATDRQTLLSADRRRFSVQTVGIDEVMALAYVGAVPVATYVDSERSFNGPVLVSEIVIDFEAVRATLTVWG